MVQIWFKSPKMVAKCFPKWSQSDPKIVPKCCQNGLKMVPKLSQNDPKMVQNGRNPKIVPNGPKLSQNGPKINGLRSILGNFGIIILEPFWDHFGTGNIFGPFGTIWTILGPGFR